MKIDCIADLHGYYPELHGGDLLIIGGDLTASDTQEQLDAFDSWLCKQPYKKKIFIAGNHDNLLIGEKPRKYIEKSGATSHERFEYLCDSGTEFEGLKIWGSPWTKTFLGMNPKCKAFTVDTEKELAEKWALIPGDIDILVTHSPPRGYLDKTTKGQCVGSFMLGMRIQDLNYKLHVFGHIHESYGHLFIDDATYENGVTFVNASHVNEVYEPINKPVWVYL